MKITKGQKFRNTSNGKVFEVLEVLPFGQLSLGVRTTVSDTFHPVIREWMNTQRNIRQNVVSGGLEIVGSA